MQMKRLNESFNLNSVVTLLLITLSLMIYLTLGGVEKSLLLTGIALALVVSTIWLGLLPNLMLTLALIFISGSLMFYTALTGGLLFQDMVFLMDIFIWYGLLLIIMIILAGRFHEIIIKRKKTMQDYAEKLEKFVVIDSDTGFDNHIRMMTEIYEEMRRADRYQQNFALLFLQLDHYREFKNLYGQRETAYLWEDLAHKIKSVSRVTDKRFRYQEDKIVILLTSTTDEYADIIFSKFKESISSHQLLTEKWVTLTYHTAFYTYQPNQEATLEEILAIVESELKVHAL